MDEIRKVRTFHGTVGVWRAWTKRSLGYRLATTFKGMVNRKGNLPQPVVINAVITPKSRVITPVTHLGGGFKYFLFSPLPGEMIQFD